MTKTFDEVIKGCEESLAGRTIETQSFFDSARPRRWHPVSFEQFMKVIFEDDLEGAVEDLLAGKTIPSGLGTKHLRLKPKADPAAVKEAALKYIELGFEVIFLDPGTKELSSRWGGVSNLSAPTLEKIEGAAEQGCNVGVWMGSFPRGVTDNYLFALDFDDPQLYEQWKVANPELSTTPTQKTASGYHVLFASESAWNGAKSEKLDFIGGGWYIVVEPSLHPDGEPYKWLISPLDTPFVQIKELEALNVPKEVWDLLEWDAPHYGRYDDDSYEWQED